MTHESTAARNTTQAVPATAGEAAGSSAVFRYLVPAWPVCGCAAGADICFHTNGCTRGIRLQPRDGYPGLEAYAT